MDLGSGGGLILEESVRSDNGVAFEPRNQMCDVERAFFLSVVASKLIPCSCSIRLKEAVSLLHPACECGFGSPLPVRTAKPFFCWWKCAVREVRTKEACMRKAGTNQDGKTAITGETATVLRPRPLKEKRQRVEGQAAWNTPQPRQKWKLKTGLVTE